MAPDEKPISHFGFGGDASADAGFAGCAKISFVYKKIPFGARACARTASRHARRVERTGVQSPCQVSPRTFKIVASDHKGHIPRDIGALVRLPGLGYATAASFLAFAYNQPTVFIETNIRTVFLLHFFLCCKNSATRHSHILENVRMSCGRDSCRARRKIPVRDDEIMPLVEQTLDRKNPRQWYSTLMDYGTMLKETYGNPNKKSAHYARQKRFEGSERELRGKLLKVCLQKAPVPIKNLWGMVGRSPKNGKRVIRAFCDEGFVRVQKGKVMLATWIF